MDFATRKNCFAIREEKKKKKKVYRLEERFLVWKQIPRLEKRFRTPEYTFHESKKEFATQIKLCKLGLGSTGAIITYAVFTAKLKANANSWLFHNMSALQGRV